MTPNPVPAGHIGPVFVVGPSRSGTTLMSRVVSRTERVRSLSEVHFFERLWQPTSGNGELSESESLALAARLVHTQHRGLFYKQGSATDHQDEALEIVHALGDGRTPLGIYGEFLNFEGRKRGGSTGCDQTPRNVFYLKEILAEFPDARVIMMVRDPRAVMLSQKNKWRRRSLGEAALPRREVVRAWSNYHPLVTARLWKGAVEAGERVADDPRVLVVRFEDLLRDAETTVRRVAEHCGGDFRPEMLDVPQVSSSLANDSSDELGLRVEMADAWRRHGGLSATEISLCEKVAGSAMRRYDYALDNLKVSKVVLAGWYAMLPVKLGVAAVMNARQIGNPIAAVRRRLS